MAKRAAPEVNAGSMADIAFLLLIFFLVTTDIATDSGLNRKLPPIADENEIPPVIKEKNIFQLTANRNNQLYLKTGGEEKLIELKDLRKEAVAFLDNGGGTTPETKCPNCQGKRNPKSSDNFNKAIISLQNDRATNYETYIAVQNEILAAYNVLRNREFQREYPKLGISFVEAVAMEADPRTDKADAEKLKEKIEKIQLLVPQKFSEAEPKK